MNAPVLWTAEFPGTSFSEELHTPEGFVFSVFGSEGRIKLFTGPKIAVFFCCLSRQCMLPDHLAFSFRVRPSVVDTLSLILFISNYNYIVLECVTTESKNHRTARVGRDVKDHVSPNSPATCRAAKLHMYY